MVSVGVLLLLGGAPPAAAHGVSAEADLALAQTIAGAELTVVVRRTETVPGPVRVDVISHRPAPGMPVALSLYAANAAGPERTAGTATVRLEAGRPGTYPADLHADRTGPHILELRAGGEVTRLPFQLLVPAVTPSDGLVYGAFGAAGVLLIGSLVTGALARRVAATLCGSAAAIAVTVAVTAALLAPLPTSARPAGRPPAQLTVETTPAPRAGEALTLRLGLYDGATGAPVDDLVPHHGALTHVVVSSRDGGFFRHVHPILTGPGQWKSRLTVDRGGTYVVDVELERVDSGGQLASGGFEVGGPARQPGPSVPARTVQATAGRPFTFEIDAGEGIQPWLGMAGHLIVRDDSATFLGHAHEQSSMTTPQLADETVATFGPTLRFTFSFPEPGRYFVWVQYMRDFEIVTVPYVVKVVEPHSSSSRSESR